MNPNSPEFIPRNYSEQLVSSDRDVNVDNVQDMVEDDMEIVQSPPSEASDDLESNVDIEGFIDDEINEMVGQEQSTYKLELDLYLARLSPAEVLVPYVEINGRKYKALIDTGASENLMKEETVRKLNLDIDDSKLITIKGLGDNKFSTKGTVKTDFSLFNYRFKDSMFNVLETRDDKYDIILGENFLKKNGFIINVNRRQIALSNKDGSRTNFYLKDDNELQTVIHERIPVYASEEVSLAKEVKPICVNFALSKFDVEKERKMLYYYGENKDGVEGLEGVLSEEQEENYVLLNSKGVKKSKVKAGDLVGYVSTVVELDEEEEESEVLWTLEEMKQFVNVGDRNSEHEKHLIYEMLKDTQDVFGKNGEVGRAHVEPHRIELTDETPIWHRPNQLPEPVDEDVRTQCKELMALDILEHSDSSWSSRIVPVRKKDGQLRICIDYRKLNSVTKPDRFPMPNLCDSVYAAHGMKYFSIIDLVKGYYQIELDKDSRKYTAFSTSHEHYQFKRVSFGLKNSGIAFQRSMQQILSDFPSKNVIIYIDDILVMTQTFEEHLTLVRKILTTLRNNGIKIKTSKCEFFKSEVTFLGHIIGIEGMKKSPEYIDKVLDYPKPTNVTELRQFLGLVNFQGKFVQNLSSLSKPLNECTSGPKRKKLNWTDEMENAFQNLKSKLVEDVVLSFPDYSKNAERLEMFVDASGVGAGGCLRQKQDGVYRTIAYASVTFSPAQVRYSTIERELVAIRWGVKVFRPFIFGIPFIIYTDHKPLLYLHNMSHENSRLMRTINELAEYDFIIRYRPGQDNAAADAMSRIVQAPVGCSSAAALLDSKLPKGLSVKQPVSGGGDSLFLSLMHCLEDCSYDLALEIPSDHVELRQLTVDLLLSDPARFNIKMNKEAKKRFKAMRHEGNVPGEEVLLAVCVMFGVEVWVHHGMSFPVVYTGDREKTMSDKDSNIPVLHLQCLSGIHFNPIDAKRRRSDLTALILSKNINSLSIPKFDLVTKKECEISETEELDLLVYSHCVAQHCGHAPMSSLSCSAQFGSVEFCTLLDSGAEVSLIDEETFNRLRRESDTVKLRDTEGRVIKGIDRTSTTVIGITELKLSVLDIQMECSTTFAVIEKEKMPCCCLLGADFMRDNDVTIDFTKGFIYGNCRSRKWCYPIKQRESVDNLDGWESSLVFSVTQSGSGDDIADNSEAEEVEDGDEEVNVPKNVKFALANSDLRAIQDADFALRQVKRLVRDNVPTSSWNRNCLSQFKRHSKNLKVQDGLLVRCSPFVVPVVSFPLLTEIVYKTHNQLAHIGRGKLIDLVSRNFWHPAIDVVAGDVCTTCTHCQLYKIAAQLVCPPTIKIQTNHPFDLIAMDLIQFTKSSRGNVVALMIVDHFSKFLMAVPLRDKKAETVTNAVAEHIIPRLVRLPNKILTDNGSEFISSTFNSLLNQYNIEHKYSTRFRPQGNGAVERSNRTITEFLKGINRQDIHWDINLPRAIMVYNNTLHRQINMCPSQFILEKAHDTSNNFPVDTTTISNWKEGHPAFAPFKVGQKVAHKINRIGRRVEYKFRQKYEGPFAIVKVQVNQVSYEIQKLGEPNGKIHKVHHRQLKPWKDPPRYLQKYIESLPLVVENSSRRDSVSSHSSSDSNDFPLFACPIDSDSDSDSSTDDCEIGSIKSSSLSSESSMSGIGNISSKWDDSSVCSSIDGFSESSSEASKETFKEKLPEVNNGVSKINLSVKKLINNIETSHNDVQKNFDSVSDSFSGFDSNSKNKTNRVSTPVKEKHSGLDAKLLSMSFSGFSENSDRNSNPMIPISAAKKLILDEVIHEKSKHNDLLNLIEQAFTYQEIMLESLEYVLDVTEFSIANGRNFVCVENKSAKEMLIGFGENEIFPTSAKLEALDAMRKQMAEAREQLCNYRSDNDETRSSWKQRSDNIENQFDKDCIGAEVSDTLCDLPKINVKETKFSRSPIMTRARKAKLDGLCNANNM